MDGYQPWPTAGGPWPIHGDHKRHYFERYIFENEFHGCHLHEIGNLGGLVGMTLL